jgi:hypothetical protein
MVLVQVVSPSARTNAIISAMLVFMSDAFRYYYETPNIRRVNMRVNARTGKGFTLFVSGRHQMACNFPSKW